MIKFKCPQCAKEISAADEHAGRKAKCPKCQTLLAIPGAKPAPAPPPAPVVPVDEDELEEAIEEAPAARRPAPPAVKAGRSPRAADEDEDVQEVEAVDEDEEERPRRRRKGGRRRRWHGEWADCPNCGAPGDATRLSYTFWGGFIGPLIINTVRCNQCGTAYNGKHGDYNTTRIIIYYAIAFGIALAVVAVCGGLSVLSGNH